MTPPSASARAAVGMANARESASRANRRRLIEGSRAWRRNARTGEEDGKGLVSRGAALMLRGSCEGRAPHFDHVRLLTTRASTARHDAHGARGGGAAAVRGVPNRSAVVYRHTL